MGERDGTLCHTEGGAEECCGTSKRHVEMEEKSTGEHPKSSQKLFYLNCKIATYKTIRIILGGEKN